MKKADIISFKVERPLLEALNEIPNRSDFIRNAVLAALENTCPLCNGSGSLNGHQRKHWESFSKNHSLKKCRQCSERHLVCENAGG